MRSKTLERSAYAAVLIHFVVNIVHGWAHSDKAVAVTMAQNLFIYPVILIGPFAAAALIWRGRVRAGYLTLALSMAGSFFFGLVWHFIIDSPDHVSHVHGGVGGPVFFWSSVALAIIEAASAALGLMGYTSTLNRRIDPVAGSTI